MKLIETEIYKKTTWHPFTQSGFRPFFLGAGLVAILSISVWFLSYGFSFEFSKGISSFWHAHEMIYGYVMAIIAGFLLTAVRNWTNMQTADGIKLMMIFGMWAIARILAFIPEFFMVQMVFDSLFLLSLSYSVGVPILKRKQMGNSPVIIVILVIFIGNAIYNFGLFSSDIAIQKFGIYFGFYTIFTLILMFIRRLVPNFLDHGLRQGTKIINLRFIDLAYIPLFVLFGATRLSESIEISNIFAILLFLLGVIRLSGWYSSEIWKKPLLWSLFLSYILIVVSFGMYGIHFFYQLSDYFSLHGLAIGGAGIVTQSMMARVSLGHTGRSIISPPKMSGIMFALMIFAVVLRAFLPIFIPRLAKEFILAGMIFWIISFTIFLISYIKILVTERPDGMYG